MNKASIFLLGDKRWSNEVKNPEFVYIDTGFWNESLGQTKNICYRQKVKNQIESWVQNGTILLTSNLVLGELDHVVGNSFLLNYAEKNKITIPKYKNGGIKTKDLFDTILEKDKEFPKKYEDELLKKKQKVKDVCQEIDYVEDASFRNLAFNIRKSTSFKIGEKDSKHYAICHQNGINNIATLDGDFWSLDNANIYTIPKQEYEIKSAGRANVFLQYDENKF